jgi:hypothetical protein
MGIRISSIQGKNGSYYIPKNVINSRIKSPHSAKRDCKRKGIEHMAGQLSIHIFQKIYAYQKKYTIGQPG